MITNNIHLMNKTIQESSGMDVIIVAASNLKHQHLLQKRLNALKGTLINPSALIFCVAEDWPNGAGNGLGTLYACLKAREMGKAEYGIDIFDLLDNGASVALYHTAGDGSRMFPLTASESGCKSLIKLPGKDGTASSHELMSILESVIKQTSIYAQAGKGRLSVFWSDQVFIPSAPVHQNSNAHIEIFTQFVAFPNAQGWKANGYSNYGVTHQSNDELLLVEKIDYQTYLDILSSRNLTSEPSLGLSLGCFSLSFPILTKLMEFFRHDLASKKVKLNSDLHFWMPWMHDQNTYVKLLHSKNYSPEFAFAHHDRMQSCLKQFRKSHQGHLFKTINIGSKSFWWDFGTVSKYFQNNMLLLKQDPEGEAFRKFYGWQDNKASNSHPQLSLENSIIDNCRLASGTVKNSILMNVTAEHVDIQDSLIINANFQDLKSVHNLLYNLNEPNACEPPKNAIKVDVSIPELNRYFKFSASLERDAHKDWEHCLPANPLSYAELNQLIHSI